jgi:hypothetical protein
MTITQEHSTSTYDATALPFYSIRNLYAGLSSIVGTHNSTVNLYNLLGESYNNLDDCVITSGSYPSTPFWNLPVATATFVRQRKLSLKQAQDLALKALASAEERRQQEREAEAKYWADLE